MKTLQGKTVRESWVRWQFQEIAPCDLNYHGTLFGGKTMHALFDKVGAEVAKRHSNRDCVTRHTETDFASPGFLGESLYFVASLNRAWHSSMEVGVKVYTVNHVKQTTRYFGYAYASFVALDENKKPVRVPPLILGTDEEKRRHLEAGVRRKFYRREKQEKKLPYPPWLQDAA